MDSDLAEKIEAQLLHWEKGRFAAYGAALTLLASSIARAFEKSYLQVAFFKSLENVDTAAFTDNGHPIMLTEPVVLNLQGALFVPYWQVLGYLLLIVILAPAAWLAFHSTWRRIPLTKRQNLIFGYLLAGWVVLLSLGVQNLDTVSDGYNVLVVGYLLFLGLGYAWLRRKKNEAEEVFP